jgi:mannitol-1-/sugar-/sorbitol-6-phosphatase
MTCGAVLFDLDGVLVDSRECVERTWRRWADHHGLDPVTVLRTAHGRRAVETIGLLAPHLAVESEAADLAAWEAQDAAGVYAVAGARALLDGLPADSWAIVTSGARAVAEFRLRLATLRMPRVMVCGDDVARGKPDPEGYLAAAARLGVTPPDCVVIEDAPPGVAAARAAGMRVVALTTTYPAEDMASADSITSTLATIYIEAQAGHMRVSVPERLWLRHEPEQAAC